MCSHDTTVMRTSGIKLFTNPGLSVFAE